MDPSVVVAAPEPSKPFKLPKVTGLVIGSVLILGAAIAAAYFLPKLIPQLKTTKIVSSTPNYSLNLNESIKKTFSTSNKYSEIIQLNEAAYSERNLDKKYKYYLTLFSKITQEYQQSKNIQFKTVLYQIKDYMRAFPQYKEGDLVLPK